MEVLFEIIVCFLSFVGFRVRWFCGFSVGVFYRVWGSFMLEVGICVIFCFCVFGRRCGLGGFGACSAFFVVSFEVRLVFGWMDLVSKVGVFSLFYRRVVVKRD